MVSKSVTTDEAVRLYNQAGRQAFRSVQEAKKFDEYKNELAEVLLDTIEREVEDLQRAGESRREAQVALLKREGCSHNAIAMILGINGSTVGEYLRRHRANYKDARDLLDAMENHDVHDV